MLRTPNLYPNFGRIKRKGEPDQIRWKEVQSGVIETPLTHTWRMHDEHHSRIPSWTASFSHHRLTGRYKSPNTLLAYWLPILEQQPEPYCLFYGAGYYTIIRLIDV